MLIRHPPMRAIGALLLSSLLPCTAVLLLSILLPCTASAMQFDYLLGLGIEHNDNVNLSDDDPISSNILEPSFGFTLNQQGSTIQAGANGLFEYRDYLGGEFSDEFRGQLAGRVNWTVSPERLDFTVEDYLGEGPVNTLQPNIPSNLQQTNVFAIGPTLNFRFGPTVRGQAELRYINSYADETDEFNTNRVSAALRAIKNLNPSSALSANLVDEHVDFTEDVAPNYDRPSAFARYTRQWKRFHLIADAGYSWLRYSDDTEDRSDPLVRADLRWLPSDRSSFSLDLAHQLSDAASGMIETGTDLGVGLGATIPGSIVIGSAATTSDAFLENRIGLGYAYHDVRTTFGVGPYYRKLDYVNETETNQTGRGATLSFTRRLRPLLTVGFDASAEDLEYPGLDRTDKTRTVQLYLERQWAQHWFGRVGYTYYKRDSNFPGQDSTQNIVFVGFVYRR